MCGVEMRLFMQSRGTARTRQCNATHATIVGDRFDKRGEYGKSEVTDDNFIHGNLREVLVEAVKGAGRRTFK